MTNYFKFTNHKIITKNKLIIAKKNTESNKLIRIYVLSIMTNEIKKT